jgi:hypothetical protein
MDNFVADKIKQCSTYQHRPRLEIVYNDRTVFLVVFIFFIIIRYLIQNSFYSAKISS